MDVKDLRTEPALSERNNDGSKYTQGGVATLQCNRNKSYQDIGSNPLAKAEGAPVRPCAVIGPDRVVPPPAASDAFLKKGSVEPWPSPDNGYRRPPDYPHRLHQNPARNISPRQTFQENMQRINVPPTYNAVRHSDSANFNHIQDRSVSLSKNGKPNMALEPKYCDVPYAINALANEPKNARESEMYVPSVNSQLTRSASSHVWHPPSVNVNVPRTYSANESYQYPQYTSCAGQRPPVMPMTRPHRTIQEDPAYVYPDQYYRDPIGRLKPYPSMKERCPQPRYEYVSNYTSQFHPPPPMQPLQYDIPKSSQPHPYMYPHFKYLENRVSDPSLEGYQRSTNHQPHYNLPYRTQVIHPTYAQVPGNTPQKVQPYPPDGSVKAIPANKLHYDNSSKMYIDYESTRNKPYPIADNYYVNEINRFHPLKNQMVMPNYPPLGMRSMPSQQYYMKDNTQIKPYDYMPTFRNFEPHLTGNPVLRHAPQFSPNTLAISPTDSSTSNDTSQTHGASQEDCGYVSQSSTTSARSIDSGIYRLPHEYYKRHDFRYGPIVGSSHTLTRTDLNSKDSKQKQIDVRQFLQMWNEGEEENNSENNSKEVIQTSSSNTASFPKHANSEDQLYVLGLVNVPSEELSKYEHIEKISKLPENIKGYNNLELFSRFEEAMESCNTTKAITKEYQSSSKDSSNKVAEALPRPISPLDVEAKISQSVIHKEVGCNFEIKPCSPKMLNVEVAATAQNILGERVIEKLSNPLLKIAKSPLPIKSDENPNCHAVIRQENAFALSENPSCKMIQSPFSSNNMDSVKTNYTLQDLEINSGVCLASLPRLDNEIELNFPEVNQQFINDNKKEQFVTANNCHHSIEDPSLPDNKEDKTDSEKTKITLSECDKTFTKLSKYRKSKTSVTDSSENKSKAVRTDSVIIKNPENIENKMLENSLNVPINLSSQPAQWYDSPNGHNENKDDDMALDFSLNKSSNDLPIIDNEILPKPFEINHSHLSQEIVSPTDATSSCQENTHVNDIKVNSKTTIESIKTNPDNVSCVQNLQDLSRDPTSCKKSAYVECIQNISKTDVNTYECIELVTVKQDPIKVVLGTTRSDSLVLKNKDYDTIENANSEDSKKDLPTINKTCADIVSEELQEPVNKYNTDENIAMHNDSIGIDKDNLENMDYENSGNITKTVKNEYTQENIIQEYSGANKNSLPIASQNENDFVHDEISANLEKLFRENIEETLPSKHDNRSSNVSVLRPLEKKIYRQSKELYSPWIQKLLTNSEGLFLNNNKLPRKEFSKSIFEPDDHNDTSGQSDIKSKCLKEELALSMKISLNEAITSMPYIKSNKVIVTDASTNLTWDSSPKIESNALIPKPIVVADNSNTTVNVLFDKKVNKPQDTMKTLVEEHIADANKLIVKRPHKVKSKVKTNDRKRNPQDGVNTSKRKIKKCKLRTSSKSFLNCDREHATDVNVNSDTNTNNFKNNIAEKYTETIISTKIICDHASISQEDYITESSKNMSDLEPGVKEEQTSKANLCKKVLTEDITANHSKGTDVPSRMFNSINTDFKFDGLVQDALIEPTLGNVFNSLASTKHKITENSNSKDAIETIVSDCVKNTEKVTITLDSCINDITVFQKQSNLCSESLSKNSSDILTEYQEQKPFEKDKVINTPMINSANINDNMNDNIRTSNIIQDDQIALSIVCDNVDTDHTTEELHSPRHLDENYLTKHCASRISDSLNISPLIVKDVDVVDVSQKVSDSFLVDNCLSNQEKDNQSADKLSEKRVSDENTKVELGKSNCTNIISVSQDHQLSCSSKNNVLNNCIETQNKEKNYKENLSQALDSDVVPDIEGHQILEVLDNSELVCTNNDVIKEDTKVSSKYVSDILTKNATGHDLIENMAIKLKKCNDNHISETLNNVNVICKESLYFQESLTSEILLKKDLENSSGDEMLDNKSRESITANISEVIMDARSNCCTNKSDTNIMQVGNTVKKNHQHVDNVSKSTNANIKLETEKNKIEDCLLIKCQTERDETEANSSIKNIELDNVANKHISNSCLDVNHFKPKADSIENENCINKKNVIIDSDIHSALSSGKCDSRSNSEPDNVIQLNIIGNTFTSMSDCVSDEWIENYNDRTTLSKNNDMTATDDEHVCCEDDKNSLCDSLGNKNLVELENHLSNIHSSENVIHESPMKQRVSLKRSFSDSALNSFKNKETPDRQLIDNTPMWAPKRQKIYDFDDSEQQGIDEKICSFIQNRRNSISSYYNAENVSFCILIDNDCILTEESEENKICFAEVSEEYITEVNTADVEDNASEVICGSDENELDFSDSVMLGYDGEKSIQESWLDDVACVETVVSDDIIEDDDSSEFSGEVGVMNYDESGIFNSDMSEITHEVHLKSEESVYDVSEHENFVGNKSPRGDVKIMLYNEEPHSVEHYNAFYSGQCLENILSKSYRRKCSLSPTSDYTESILLPDDTTQSTLPEDKENIFEKDITLQHFENDSAHSSANRVDKNTFSEDIDQNETCSIQHDTPMHLPKSNVDNLFNYKKEDDVSYATSSSSPEVSSTTFEEKSSSILLKITNYNGSRVSEINEVNRNRPRCKFTESKDYSNSNGSFPKRPLVTKAAQKYIPPLKESIRDLKVKLPLPRQRLLKLKQLKLTKSEPKVVKENILTIPKKQKPKLNFEDVLKNIDEVQIKMHKQNNKKIKNIVPKVVIKKNGNGSHYTSSTSKEIFNPDLTGRKWQPWVFLERDRFIDKMATTNKTKAVFSYRKNTYVLAEKFKKYKSASSSSAKFVISQPKTGSSKGQLKYTIRLKHA